MAIWGTTWAAIRVSLEGIPPFWGVSLRFGIAGALLLVLCRLRGVALGRSRRERWLWVANGLLSFCVSYGIVYWAEQRIPSGLASVLFATFPLWVAILAHFLLPGERMRGRSTAGTLLAFAGVAVIFSEDLSAVAGPGAVAASLVMLVSPLASAMGSVAVKRWGHGVHPFSLSAVPMLLTAAVMGAVAAPVEGWGAIRWTPPATLALLYLAILGSAVTFSLYFWLLGHLDASRLALIAYAIPVVAVVVGAVVFAEPLTTRIVVGSGLVVLGVALAVHRRAGRLPPGRAG